jgi:hypothetical protein
MRVLLAYLIGLFKFTVHNIKSLRREPWAVFLFGAL